MARIRTIKPEFWASEDVAAVCRDARLLFIGLLNFADDSGNGPASPKGLIMKVFPGDSDVTTGMMEKWLGELDRELIGLYEAKGKQYYHVMKWEHQRIDKPQKAKYPPFVAHSRKIPISLPPDSIVKDRIVRDGKGKESIAQIAFEQFWEAWPRDRKVGKKKCRDWFKTHNPEPTIVFKMLDTIPKWIESEEWDEPKFIPHPSTWLNREGWDDIPPPPKFEPEVKREEMPDYIIAGSAAEKEWLAK